MNMPFRRYPPQNSRNQMPRYIDYGPEPFVINIEEATRRNRNFRTTPVDGKPLAADADEYSARRRYRLGNSSQCRSVSSH